MPPIVSMVMWVVIVSTRSLKSYASCWSYADSSLHLFGRSWRLELLYDIIIPHCGISPQLTRYCLQCLTSIREHSSRYRLILVDNDSQDLPQILEELKHHRPHLLIRNSNNAGFVKAVNQA